MADYSSYLPVTPGLETFAGISPEEAAQIGQYRSPDVSGHIHPMGGLALGGQARRQAALGQYLQALQAGNVWRQEQMNRAIQANLREAAVNQIGRFGPELLRQGDLRLLAGSDFGNMELPGLQDQSGQPSDAAVEADTNARLLKQGEDMKNVAQAGLANVQAGYHPDLPQFAQRWGLPLTPSVPLAVQVAELHRRGMAAAGGGKPLKTGTETYWDPVQHKYITRYTFANPGDAVSGGQPSASAPAVASSAPASAQPQVSPDYTPTSEEELSADQDAQGQAATADAMSRGYRPVGYFTKPDRSVVFYATAPNGTHLEWDLGPNEGDVGTGDGGD